MAETFPRAMQSSASTTACFKYFSSIVLELHNHTTEWESSNHFFCIGGEMQYHPLNLLLPVNYFWMTLALGPVFVRSLCFVWLQICMSSSSHTHTHTHPKPKKALLFFLGFVLAPLEPLWIWRLYWGWADVLGYDEISNGKARINLSEEIGYGWAGINP